MWREAGLLWKDFLPEDEDVNKFVTEQVRGHSRHKPHYQLKGVIRLLAR